MFSLETFTLYTILILGTANLVKFIVLFISTDLFHFYQMFSLNKANFTPLNKSIAIVIPAHNEELVIKATLESVFENKYNNFKVYIADDGSTDNTKQEVSKYILANPTHKLEYVYNVNSGKAEALNNIIRNYVKEDLVMCLDADCLLTEKAIERAVIYFDNPEVVSMISNVKIIPGKSIVNFVQRMEYSFGFFFKKGLSVANIEYIVGGAGSVFTREILKEVNYYDSDTITEDMDLSMKIIQAGKHNRIVFGNDVVVWTQGPTTGKDLLKQRYRWKLGWSQTILKNKDMIFSFDKRFNWLFTLYYLPYAIFSQFVFIFEPIFIVLAISFSIINNNWFIAFYLPLYYSILKIISILGDDSLPLKMKIYWLLMSPLGYFTMSYVSAVEFAATIMCIINYKKIVNFKNNKHTSWSHVKRISH
jgi:poly-beta-1,6-N-acetyl-D-glucosamine synthase